MLEQGGSVLRSERDAVTWRNRGADTREGAGTGGGVCD